MSAEAPEPETAWSAHLKAARLKRIITFSVIGVLVAAALAMGLPVVLSPPRSVVIAPRQSSPPSGVSTTSTIVHVVGAVVRPGLVSLSPGARVIDAVMRAGGLVATADQCAVNLARAITDGEQILIPFARAGVTSCVQNAAGVASTANAPGAAKVSLSRASLEQLDALPGVGPALAQRIIDWRTAHGGFQSVSQLDSVSGIGVKLMASLKPLVVP